MFTNEIWNQECEGIIRCRSHWISSDVDEESSWSIFFIFADVDQSFIILNLTNDSKFWIFIGWDSSILNSELKMTVLRNQGNVQEFSWRQILDWNLKNLVIWFSCEHSFWWFLFIEKDWGLVSHIVFWIYLFCMIV